jgi:hypothetical protein
VVKVGIDPHFSYAYMLLNVAWARAHGTASFLFADAPQEALLTERPGGVVSPVVAIVREQTVAMLANVCGDCLSYNDGRCSDRFVRVKAGDPGCDLFVAA